MASFSASPLAYVLLFIAAAVAGFVDSIAGGGGIITLPALLAAGLPPHLALGTNKLQSSFGSLSATLRYRAGGMLRLRDIVPGLAATAIGAALGALAVGAVSSRLLSLLIPIFLVCILVFMALRPRFGLDGGTRRLGWLPFWVSAGLALGFYDGFFGPGTGTFLIMAYVWLWRDPFDAASANAKVANFASNLAAVAVFAAKGLFFWKIALAMGCGEALGAFAGAHVTIRRGQSVVRGMVIAVSLALVARLAWQMAR